MVTAPPVVRAIAIGVISAAEVGRGKGRDLAGCAQLLRRAVKGVEAAADIGEQGGMRARGGVARVDLSVVQVPAADAREKDLAFQVELRGCGDQARDGPELLAQAGIGEGRGER